jgi:hypothetical protein
MAIIVPILSTFDAAGVNKAQRAFKGLSGTAKVSAVAFGALGLAITKFGFDAVKAAAEDQKAQLKLAKTLQNVTGATQAQTAAVEKFITAQQFATGVSDTQLRPALETLVRATGDVTKAQGLLKLSLDVSQGSGRDLETISIALAKAQGGQFTALQRLGIVIPENIKKSKDFAKVQEYLNTLFGGQAAVAAGTYEGKLAILGQRTGELKESIGGALLPALTNLVDYIIINIMPALEGFINGLSGKQSVASSFDKSAEAGYSWGQNVRAFIQTVVSYQKPLLVFAGVLAGIWAVSKTVAAVGAIVKVIQALITVYKALQTTAVLAATAMAFASGGTSVAVGLIGAAAAAAGIAAAFVGVNKVIDTYSTKVEDLPKITYTPDGIIGGTKRSDVSLAPMAQATTGGKSTKAKDASKVAAAASKAAADAAKKATAEMAKQVAAASKLATAALTKMNDKLIDAREELQLVKDASKALGDGFRDSITGLLNFGDAASQTTGSFLENLRKQSDGAIGFADKVKQLIALGLNKTGIQQVLDAGAIAGTKIADELIAGGAGVINDTNKFIESIQSAADSLAKVGEDKFYQAGITSGQAMVNGIIASIKKAGFIMSGGMAALPKPLQSALNKGKLTSGQASELMGIIGNSQAVTAPASKSGTGTTINVTVNAGMGANGTTIGRDIVDAIKKYERVSGPVFLSA